MIENTTFSGCKSNGNGGAIAVTHEISTDGLQNDRIKKKRLVIDQCTFIRCCSNVAGGAIYLQKVEKVAISESNFIRCTANTGGGAISITNTDITAKISKCRFVRNEARLGGGVYLRSNIKHRSIVVRIKNSSFHNNKAVAFGQAIYSTATAQGPDANLRNFKPLYIYMIFSSSPKQQLF